MKKFFESITSFLVALGTVATACATIYSEYNKQKNSDEKKEIESKPND